MKYTAIINDKRVEFDYDPGDRVAIKYRPTDTGTVVEVEHRLFIRVDWDEHCKKQLGSRWMPDSLINLTKEGDA